MNGEGSRPNTCEGHKVLHSKLGCIGIKDPHVKKGLYRVLVFTLLKSLYLQFIKHATI